MAVGVATVLVLRMVVVDMIGAVVAAVRHVEADEAMLAVVEADTAVVHEVAEMAAGAVAATMMGATITAATVDVRPWTSCPPSVAVVALHRGHSHRVAVGWVR